MKEHPLYRYPMTSLPLFLRITQKEGVDIDEVDWVVAHGGADIRHASAEGGSWTADDAWEEHIDWRCVSLDSFR